MCILFLAINQHPNYPVVICANRDEFHQRPTQEMHWWQQPKVLAGKDLQAGGSWLALTSNGKFSALTNFRQKLDENAVKQSRGDLVLKATTENTNTFCQLLPQISTQYNGFNLIFGELENLQCYNSINSSFHPLSDGFHSVCNGALDDIWPKMALGQKTLEANIRNCAQKNTKPDVTKLFTLMTNELQAPTEKLPVTGIPVEWEKLLSSIFITSPDYGTRSTTIILLDVERNVEVCEKSYSPSGKVTKDNSFNYRIEK